jgi:membrane-bound ClpP family serine protease
MDTFSDSGTITVRGEIWKATAARGLVQRGDKVRVVEVGPELTLVVEKLG